MNWLWCAIAGFASGVLGAMGMGGGGILIIYFALFTAVPQDLAQGINLIFFIPIALFSVLVYWKKKLIRWKIALPFALFGVIGSLIGTFFSGMLNDDILSKLFGGLLIIMGIKTLFTKTKSKNDETSKLKKT